MHDLSKIDYSHLDRPEILRVLFHPRIEYGADAKPPGATDVLIPVDEAVVVGARFHMAHPSAPNILFFHGNGEIAADYDDIGPLYNRLRLNFLAADYRGYGQSTGKPTVTAMIRDCHIILEYSAKWLEANGYSGPLLVMGRSLGSASALELASRYKDRLSGLVIESGFAYTGPLLKLLGINLEAVDFNEEKGPGNLEKIKTWDKPALIIHAEFDHIIGFSEGKALYHACPSADKTLLKIPGATHNDIFVRGLSDYMNAVRDLAARTG